MNLHSLVRWIVLNNWMNMMQYMEIRYNKLDVIREYLIAKNGSFRSIELSGKSTNFPAGTLFTADVSMFVLEVSLTINGFRCININVVTQCLWIVRIINDVFCSYQFLARTNFHILDILLCLLNSARSKENVLYYSVGIIVPSDDLAPFGSRSFTNTMKIRVVPHQHSNG